MIKVEVFITYFDDYGYYDGKDYVVKTFEVEPEANGYILGIREGLALGCLHKLTILKDGKEI